MLKNASSTTAEGFKDEGIKIRVGIKNSVPVFFFIYISSCNLCLSICLSDHNSENPGPICLKF